MDPYDALALDLIARTETAVRSIAELSTDTGITFRVEDVVDVVERDLPDDYLVPAYTEPPRRTLITNIVQDVLSGAMYQD